MQLTRLNAIGRLSFLTILLSILVLGACSQNPEPAPRAQRVTENDALRGSRTNSVSEPGTHIEPLDTPDVTFSQKIKDVIPKESMFRIDTKSDVYVIRFSRDGDTVVSGASHKKMLSLWNTADLSKKRDIKINVPLASLDNVIELNDDRLVVNGYKHTATWDANTGEVLSPPEPYSYKEIESPDKRFRAVIANGRATVSRIEDGSAVVSSERAKPWKMLFSPNSEYFAVSYNDDSGHAEVWALEDGERVANLVYYPATFSLIRFSSDGTKFLAGAYKGRVIVWDIAAQKKIVSIQAGVGLRDLSISPDGSMIATGGTRNFAEAGLAAIWDANTGAQLFAYRSGARVSSTPFSADGRYWAAGTWDGYLVLWARPDR